MGYRADIACNGLEAIKALERQAYDLIFMDVQMPEMDGMEATRRIRQRQEDPSAPPSFQRPIMIIAMTANAMHGDRDKCIAAGMNDYVPKPIRPEALQAAIERIGAALAKSAVTPATISANIAPAFAPAVAAPLTPVVPSGRVASSTGEPPVDLERLLEFAGGYTDNFHELVGLYLDQTSGQLAQLQTAIHERAAAKVASVAHSCAGASATCGMVAIVPLLRRLERAGNEGELSNAAEQWNAVQAEFQRIKRFLEQHPRSPVATQS
jgi:CheY-like chemotaxis protein/HPt (histidine-containing phosphotransfer) domain-containing protein